MQKITFVVVGKIKESFYREGVAEYQKRLSRFAKVEIKEVAEGRSLEEEGEDILRQVKGELIVLAIEGRACSSEDLAELIKQAGDSGKELTFVIGSSEGLCKKVKDSAHTKISFSKMTFPHQLMRVILAEQVYRAFMINSGSTYHK